ncbi:unnamed protein product [Caretta caretta]
MVWRLRLLLECALAVEVQWPVEVEVSASRYKVENYCLSDSQTVQCMSSGKILVECQGQKMILLKTMYSERNASDSSGSMDTTRLTTVKRVHREWYHIRVEAVSPASKLVCEETKQNVPPISPAVLEHFFGGAVAIVMSLTGTEQ